MLEVSHQAFNYWVYRTPEIRRYTTFYIPKKKGKSRKIDAPTNNIKILQQKLNQVLQAVYRSKPSAHGFVEGKSVRSNAAVHIKKTWVLNLDLEDFFPSINFGRVRGMFMAKPYNVPERVATVLAHLCCYNRYLPQGAPTSPVVSNMICARMDSELQRLAARNRCTYTRYADDITFSTTQRRFPRNLAYYDGLKQIQPGHELLKVIADNGFSVNHDKVWLRGRSSRQTVTGVTVNEFPNLPKK
ncbi:MAG: reverse transcriptase domain-containing protein [Chloroflexota bacterium]|nr:reverse transcriptase domain-containing protein [Chloroflexota bacterium]